MEKNYRGYRVGVSKYNYFCFLKVYSDDAKLGLRRTSHRRNCARGLRDKFSGDLKMNRAAFSNLSLR